MENYECLVVYVDFNNKTIEKEVLHFKEDEVEGKIQLD